MLKQFILGVMGGIMISIGGCVYLASKDTLITGKFVGAFFFSVAFICICLKGYGLYTGRVGYLPDNFSGGELAGLGMTLLGNAVATLGLGALVGGTTETLRETAYVMSIEKVGEVWYTNLLRAVLCGVLMYLAVSIYREKNTMVGILFCVPAFILAGFEHSVADMFYIGVAGSGEGLSLLPRVLFLLLVVVGNAIGGMLLPLLSRLTVDNDTEGEDEDEEEDDEDEVDE